MTYEIHLINGKIIYIDHETDLVVQFSKSLCDGMKSWVIDGVICFRFDHISYVKRK